MIKTKCLYSVCGNEHHYYTKDKVLMFFCTFTKREAVCLYKNLKEVREKLSSLILHDDGEP